MIQNHGKLSNVPGLNWGLSLNFFGLRSANHMKFTEEYVMYMKMHVLINKMFTNGLNMGLLLTSQSKRQSIVETHWLSGKEIVLGAAVSKDHAVIVFWDIKGPIAGNFLEKFATVNSVSYCLLFMQNSTYLLNVPCIINWLLLKELIKKAWIHSHCALSSFDILKMSFFIMIQMLTEENDLVST